jgi:cobalamin biosynthesis Mg chelatase CobN
MTEESKQGEMPENTQPEPKSAEMVQISAAELEKIRAALKSANAEAAKHRIAAEKIEADKKAREEAEMSELDKTRKEARELKARVAQMERDTLAREIAAKVGLPAKLATRLQGNTAEEMEQDAQAILEALPKPGKPPPGPVANPGANGQQGETVDQQLARIHGHAVNPWDVNLARQKGGGVFYENDPRGDK